MKILDRYIGKTIIGAILTVLLVLVGIFSFFSFIDQLDDLGRGRYGLVAVVQFIALSMPRLTYELFPIGALIGSLVGLGTLVGNSEVAVMRSAGVSVWRMVVAIMKAGALMMVLAVFVGEFLSPPAEQWARHARSIAIADQIALKTRNGFWARDGQSYINIRTVRPGDRVEDIYIYEFDDDNQLKVSTYARRATFVDGQWILEDIAQTVIREGRVSNRQMTKAAWDSLLRPDLINMVVIKPNNLASYDLVKYIRYLKTNGQETQRYEQALWTKMIYPLATGAMVLLAIPIVLGARRTVPIGQRVVLGSLIGLGFRLLNQATANAGIAYELNALLSALFPTLVTFAVAIYLMYRMTRLKQSY
jgi:lipopolysaccharide export system permease protein